MSGKTASVLSFFTSPIQVNLQSPLIWCLFKIAQVVNKSENVSVLAERDVSCRRIALTLKIRQAGVFTVNPNRFAN